MSKNIFCLTREGLKKIMQEKEMLEKKKDYILKYEIEVFKDNRRSDPDFMGFEELAVVRNRLKEIKNILDKSKLIERELGERGKISLGATVTLEDEGKNDDLVFEIVDSLEANPSTGKISKNSPIGKALLGHKIQETIFVSNPVNKSYTVKNINYSIY